MQSNFSLLFYLKKPKNYASGPIPIYARITVDGERTELSANREVEPSDWNIAAGKMKGTKENVKSLNAYLDLFRANMYAAQQVINQKEEKLTAQNLKDTYLGKEQKIRFILDIFREHNHQVNALIGNEFSQGTATRYETSLKHTQNFIKWKYRLTDIDIKKIDHEFITSYDFYLRTERKCNNNSTVKYIKNFKKIINICLANGWMDKNPFINYKAKTKQIDREYLSQDEIDRLIKKVFLTERLHQVREIFLFSCYTGLAYADVKKLKKNEITKGVDGEMWIITHRTKTLTPTRIPLLPFAIQLLERYEDNPACCTKGIALPVLSNQKMNAYLKEIADLCGITKSLTFHIARHTFATTITLANGVPIETVSKMLGHTTIRMTQHYAKILDITVGKDMAVLKEKLNNTHLKKETKQIELPAIEIPKELNTPSSDDGEVMLCTNYILAAKIETREWIAPILRESKRYEGLKISVDPISFERYLKYRLQGEFEEWEEFYEKGETSSVTIHYLAGTDFGHIREAGRLLNNSRYLQEGKISVLFAKMLFDNDLFSWVEI